MRTTLIALGALLLTTGCAAAGGRERARETFRQLDTNGDRKLEFSEIEAARARLFDRMDTNHDGILEPAEMQAAREWVASSRAGAFEAPLSDLQRREAVMDRNDDGRISRSEFASFIPDRLARADTNGDQALSLWELRSLRR